jgi:hypothetical protein
MIGDLAWRILSGRARLKANGFASGVIGERDRPIPEWQRHPEASPRASRFDQEVGGNDRGFPGQDIDDGPRVSASRRSLRSSFQVSTNAGACDADGGGRVSGRCSRTLRNRRRCG